ncbi:MAG: pro-sigmaK processing inhibitor BofA family protein [Clostridia bacterium]|nr:pro-sigmaK processing inhibitor BofA family protein [Clostridia bacterium]
MDQVSVSILTYIGGLIFLIFMLKLFSKPLKVILKLCLNSVLGCLIMVIINSFSQVHGIFLGINPVTAAVCGILGLPGVVLLVLLQVIL